MIQETSASLWDTFVYQPYTKRLMLHLVLNGTKRVGKNSGRAPRMGRKYDGEEDVQ
jgi:hypothetical protein